MKHEQLIKKQINELPKRIRRERLSSLNRHMCNLHYGVNADVVCDIMELIMREVEYHPRWFKLFPHLTKPLDRLILNKVSAIGGMWIEWPDKPVIPDLWSYQENKCHACMVARVASNKNASRNMRVSLLSRTPTRKRHQPRRLMKFVDMCIDQFPEYIDELYGTSSQFAYILKDTRKKCIKAWYNDPANEGKRSRRHRHGSGHPKRSDSKYDPRKVSAQAPPDIASRHPSQQAESDLGGPPSWILRAGSEIEEHSMHRESSIRANDSISSRQREDSVAYRHTSRSLHGTKGYEAGRHHSRSYGQSIKGHKHSTREHCRSDSSPAPSSAIRPPDEVDKLIAMYRNMGMDPYKRRAEGLATYHNDHQASSSVEVPLTHQYTASEYTPSVYSVESEWIDDEVIDWDAHEKQMSKAESEAMTVWSMVCGEANRS
ncbi:hypothetical protein N7508_002767 [Penicillium antarcticum]|uniref:uncharacterized protein n=1 Tax=Penicillium antarcticum TaxID=416450 RepID=UPI002386BB30|nr:uncharacterized protein N7508_002767 [Penicillium antarcticum]KAJ5311937.1 hypothetical protein N7508_002767 [Penicillium antarcticum]